MIPRNSNSSVLYDLKHRDWLSVFNSMFIQDLPAPTAVLHPSLAIEMVTWAGLIGYWANRASTILFCFSFTHLDCYVRNISKIELIFFKGVHRLRTRCRWFPFSCRSLISFILCGIKKYGVFWLWRRYYQIFRVRSLSSEKIKTEEPYHNAVGSGLSICTRWNYSGAFNELGKSLNA